MEEEPTRVTYEQKLTYQERGYYFPVKVFSNSETEYYRECLFDYRSEVAEQLKAIPPRDQYVLFSETHTFLYWVYQMVTQERVLDAVEDIIGPNLMVWNTRWFIKMPGDKMFITWHQDAAYWGLHPADKVTTAWIALSNSYVENGCMRVVPGTHRDPVLPQTDTYDPNNALSRGQEIAVAIDEAQAVDITLRPGEISLHHIGIVHGSRANTSEEPRIGLAVRYISPEVVQDGSERQFALLVRGKDYHGNFDTVHPPPVGATSADNAIHSEAVARMIKNLVPNGY